MIADRKVCEEILAFIRERVELPKNMTDVQINIGHGGNLMTVVATYHPETKVQATDSAVARCPACDHPQVDDQDTHYRGCPHEWVDWPGGECPVEPDTKVLARLRDGTESKPGGASPASFLRWDHETGAREGDIIAYKVVADTDAGWIHWHGGECPVQPSTKVLVQLRRGSRPRPNALPTTANSYRWWHGKRPNDLPGSWSDDDIVAYKVVEDE